MTDIDQSWDVIVVGAGAAGLFAAATSAARGRKTLLIEKNRKLGVKILMSGGTRCNITQDTTWQGIADAFGKQQGRFLKFSLATMTPQLIVDFFNQQGVATKIESTGKIFPESDKAIDVRDALVTKARVAGCRILNETAVKSIEKTNDGFVLKTDDQDFQCQSVIVTTGGRSYPGCGTTGDGYEWLSELGHSIIASRPALTPIRLSNEWARELSGVTIPDMSVHVRLNDAPKTKQVKQRNDYRGSFLFTHKGCSGPAVLNVSRVVTDPANNFTKELICNWLPGLTEEQWRADLNAQGFGATGKQVGNFLAQHLPRRLGNTLCELAEIPIDQSFSNLGKKQTNRLIEQTLRCNLEITGTLGFAKAEVTAGGVALGEVDQMTMVSKMVPGLFLAGEILDVDGPIGGYNFQAAFATGFVAGSNA